jgi:hypothetical protein
MLRISVLRQEPVELPVTHVGLFKSGLTYNRIHIT